MNNNQLFFETSKIRGPPRSSVNGFQLPARLKMPDNVYNWIVDFLECHSHQTVFGGQRSEFLKISASIVQGSGFGPALFSIVDSDLHPITLGNRLFKFADDCYLVIPASNEWSRSAEMTNVQNWATANNLLLNTKKCQEMVFRRPRERANGSGIAHVARVSSMKILGVVICNFSMDNHHVVRSGTVCPPRSHGMSEGSLQSVFQSTVVSRLTYASPAWRGFASAAESWSIPEEKHEGRTRPCLRNYVRHAKTIFSDPSWTTTIIHYIIFSKMPKLRNTRTRTHPYQLPNKGDSLHQNNFMRMLYKNIYWESKNLPNWFKTIA